MEKKYKIEDKIWNGFHIQCSYCNHIEVFTTENIPTKKDKAMFVDNLVLWVINEHGAVKCPPCQWKNNK